MPLWTNHFIGPIGDQPTALAVDRSGNVFVTGYTYNPGAYFDYATVAYSGAGAPLWTNLYNGLGNEIDEALAVAVDGNGNVFVAGYSWEQSGSFNAGYDYVTIKYVGAGAGAPLLTIIRSSNSVVLSWPSAATNFGLQWNTNLATTNWTPVGATPADDGTNKTLILNPTADTFYRLTSP